MRRFARLAGPRREIQFTTCTTTEVRRRLLGFRLLLKTRSQLSWPRDWNPGTFSRSPPTALGWPIREKKTTRIFGEFLSSEARRKQKRKLPALLPVHRFTESLVSRPMGNGSLTITVQTDPRHIFSKWRLRTANPLSSHFSGTNQLAVRPGHPTAKASLFSADKTRRIWCGRLTPMAVPLIF